MNQPVTVSATNMEDPFFPAIQKFVSAEFPNTFKTSQAVLLDILTDAIVATGSVRYGPRPSPESLVAIREVVSYWLALNRPIPFLVPWGSEKPNGSGIDVAELAALRTMNNLDQRVRAHYSPGVVLNVRLEDVSAPHLFIERMEAARAEARLYTDGFVNLVNILGMPFVVPKPESRKVSEITFNQTADVILPAMTHHVLNPDIPEYVRELKTLGWDKPLPPETIAYYMASYAKLYPDKQEYERKMILARYFAGALARKMLDLSGAEPEWRGRNLELSFIGTPPGFDPKRTLKRLSYRTMPSSITSMHMAPWRAKGYLRVSEEDVSATLASWQDAHAYNPFCLTFERDGVSQDVQADYIIQ